MKKTRKFMFMILSMIILISLTSCQGKSSHVETTESAKPIYTDDLTTTNAGFAKKMSILKEHAINEDTLFETGKDPAGDAGHAVFISVSDTASRALVFTGTGETLADAWNTAILEADKGLTESVMLPHWIKVDITYLSETIPLETLNQAILASRSEFFRYGVAFDGAFDTALLEAELNGSKIFNYDDGCIDMEYLNNYLQKQGRESIKKLPENVTVFQCMSWFCDETNQVYDLYATGLEYGRRKVNLIDDTYAESLIDSSMDFLLAQQKEDGSFIYGMYPRFDNEIENYNIVRHAAAIWSMVCRYRMTGETELAEKIELAINYLIDNILYADDNTAYLYEAKSDEIKLGGNGLAVIAMTEYMDAVQTDKYEEICTKLGNGILTMMDQQTGKYYHVLNGDFTQKEEFRTVYYDGEATFGLCQLYEMTGEQHWLDAAVAAVENFIANDYGQYNDHWVAYSMNAITQQVDEPRYYQFALDCITQNVQDIYERDTTYHTYLELLMATFELYDRMIENGMEDRIPEDFDIGFFLKTIYDRADRMLNGFFYPEYAMYMENPARVAGTFMVRHDGYRIRIDDIQHNIGGYYLYYKNYEKLVKYGMLEYSN